MRQTALTSMALHNESMTANKPGYTRAQFFQDGVGVHTAKMWNIFISVPKSSFWYKLISAFLHMMQKVHIWDSHERGMCL